MSVTTLEKHFQELDGVKSPGLKYQRLQNALMRELEGGGLKPGDALPTEQALAEMMNIARSTVRQAMDGLERKGIIRRVRGKGTFVEELKGSDGPPKLQSLALLTPEVERGFYPSLIRGFTDKLRDHHRAAVVCGTNDDVNCQANSLMQMIHQRVSGIVLVPTAGRPTPAYQIQQVQDHNIPVVLLHRSVAGVVAPRVEIPGHQIGYAAGRAIVERGHQRVAMVVSSSGKLTELYIQGFKQALAESGVELPESMIVRGQMAGFSRDDYDQYEAFIEEQFTGLLARPDRPTAIYDTFESTAKVLYMIAMRQGVSVPGDLSLVTFGGSFREGVIARQLTAVTVNEAAAAATAVDLIDEICSGKRPIRDDHVSVMTHEFYAGQTLAGP